MKVAVLFSGGKDSSLATFLAQKNGYKIACLISIFSENKESYMFHTPSISEVKKQAYVMNIPLVIQKTEGEKETELKDLKEAIKNAKKNFKFEGIVTGAVGSIYQSSRIQKICNDLNLECFNPLWQKDQFEILDGLIRNKFKVIVTGVFAYPLNKSWLGREINKSFIEDIKKLNKNYKINPAGEGGEFETFVLNCQLFKRPLKIKSFKDISSGENSWRREIEAK